LSLDPATGIISGTPLPGSHGIFEGYVLSVEDTLGRGTSSAEFAIKIRHQDTVSIDMANVPFRNGAPVVAPEPAVTNPHALVGQSECSTRGLSGGMDVSVDPQSGIIYGTISSAQNKSLTLTLTDEIGVAASKVVTFVRQAAALQFAALTQKAGTQVDQQASITPI